MFVRNGLIKPFLVNLMEKAYRKKLNRFLVVNFMAAFIGFPLIFANTPVLAVKESPIRDHSLLAVSSALNPSLEVEDDSKESNLAMSDNIFLQSFCANQENCENEIKSELIVAKVKKDVVITAYSSTPDQTDSSPFITANGTWVYDGVIACNFLPFGTKVHLPDFSGDKIYTVEDRMAKRFSYKMDIWMETRGEALEFGVQKLTVEILK